MQFTAGDYRDMTRFGAPAVFLQENPLGIVNSVEPRTGFLDGFAHDGVNRAKGRAEGVLDDVGSWITAEDLLGFETVSSEVGFWKRDAVILAESVREITVAFEAKTLPDRTEDRRATLD